MDHPPVMPDPNAQSTEWPPSTVTIPQLVSGIMQVLGGIAYISTCLGAILGIPLVLLGAWELVTYSKARSMQPAMYAERTKVLAIIDICTSIGGNVPSAVCGIVTLTQLPEARRRAGIPG